MTSSNGNIFRVTGPLWGESIRYWWIPPQRPVTRNFDVSFDPRLNKRLSKQSRHRWFETPLDDVIMLSSFMGNPPTRKFYPQEIDQSRVDSSTKDISLKAFYLRS